MAISYSGTFGTFVPGDTSADLEAWQQLLQDLGYSLNVTGRYDSDTSLAVQIFRTTYGLPFVDTIDDAFTDKLTAIYEAKFPGKPPGPRPGDTQVFDPLNITGKAGAGVGLLALLLGGWWLWKRKR